MKLWKLLLIFCVTTSYGQVLLQENVEQFVGVDVFENYYYIKNETLCKSKLTNTYQNLNYGTPDIVDVSDPLQVILFYRYFNKVVVLDNLLNYISEFEVPYEVQLIANAGKDKLWVYDNLNMKLSLFNFKSQKIEISSVPVSNTIKRLKGNLNKAIVLDDENKLKQYNYLAREEDQSDVKDCVLPLSLYKEYYIKGNTLYKQGTKTNIDVYGVEVFEVINQQLYLLKDKHIYKLPISKK